MSDRITRRAFARRGVAAAAGLTAASASRVLGANETIRLAFIGVANRGMQLHAAFAAQPDARTTVMCDVDKTILAAVKKAGGDVETCEDFRKIYGRKDIDAVVIATPDHWHAIQTVDACDAGLDVYVEKPLSITIHEGRRMVEAARRNKRVVQVGLHRRSSSLYADLAGKVQAGKIGKVTVARCYRLNNMFPAGIGRMQEGPPPETLNWDLWLGPRPSRAYQENIHPYKFRWWHLYSSQMGNWGVHYLDAIRWMTGETAPASVSAHGGRFAVEDDRTIPDTMEAVFEFASGRLAIFGQYEASSNPALYAGEVELRGTQGTLYASEKDYEIVPERGGQFQTREPRMEAEKGGSKGSNSNLTALHARNFLDCVKSRAKPNADVEDGHRSTTFALLANIALAMKCRLEWDAQKERVTNSEEANKLLHYEYRKPWELK